VGAQVNEEKWEYIYNIEREKERVRERVNAREGERARARERWCSAC